MKVYNVNVCLNGVVLKAKNRQDLQTVGANVQDTISVHPVRHLDDGPYTTSRRLTYRGKEKCQQNV